MGMEVGHAPLFPDRLVLCFTPTVYQLSEWLDSIVLVWQNWSFEDEACRGRWWRLSDSPKEDSSVDGSPRCTRRLQSVNVPLTWCVRTLWGPLEKTALKNPTCRTRREHTCLQQWTKWNQPQVKRAALQGPKHCSAPQTSHQQKQSGFNNIYLFCPGKDLVWKKPRSEP